VSKDTESIVDLSLSKISALLESDLEDEEFTSTLLAYLVAATVTGYKINEIIGLSDKIAEIIEKALEDSPQ
jgi:hypothetical protein